MCNRIVAVVPVMLVRLNGPLSILGTREQDVSARSFGGQPIKSPPPPCISLYRIKKARFGPGLTTISAHGDLRHFDLAGPRSAEDGACTIRHKSLINTWPGDCGLQLDFC